MYIHEDIGKYGTNTNLQWHIWNHKPEDKLRSNDQYNLLVLVDVSFTLKVWYAFPLVENNNNRPKEILGVHIITNDPAPSIYENLKLGLLHNIQGLCTTTNMVLDIMKTTWTNRLTQNSVLRSSVTIINSYENDETVGVSEENINGDYTGLEEAWQDRTCSKQTVKINDAVPLG